MFRALFHFAAATTRETLLGGAVLACGVGGRKATELAIRNFDLFKDGQSSPSNVVTKGPHEMTAPTPEVATPRLV